MSDKLHRVYSYYSGCFAPDRLDFTMIGPAVNRTAKLESLTKTIGENFLLSKSFSGQVDCPMRYLGEHAMKGILVRQKVYPPAKPASKKA